MVILSQQVKMRSLVQQSQPHFDFQKDPRGFPPLSLFPNNRWQYFDLIDSLNLFEIEFKVESSRWGDLYLSTHLQMPIRLEHHCEQLKPELVQWVNL